MSFQKDTLYSLHGSCFLWSIAVPLFVLKKDSSDNVVRQYLMNHSENREKSVFVFKNGSV